MLKKILVLSSAAVLPILMTGCYTLAVVNFGNGTTARVRVMSSQTGEEIEIKPGAFKKLPHSTGDLIVEVHSRGQFKFTGVEPPALDITDASYLAKQASPFGPGKITLRVRLETNMQLYALMPGKKTVDSKIEQPDSYPKSGEKMSD